jgi:hypothetical protein
VVLQGAGDTVVARALPDQPGVVLIDKIEGDNGRLSLVAKDNCVGIAATETLKLIGATSCGVALTLYKVASLLKVAGSRLYSSAFYVHAGAALGQWLGVKCSQCCSRSVGCEWPFWMSCFKGKSLAYTQGA